MEICYYGYEKKTLEKDLAKAQRVKCCTYLNPRIPLTLIPPPPPAFYMLTRAGERGLRVRGISDYTNL
jgi:hypothetical protein